MILTIISVRPFWMRRVLCWSKIEKSKEVFCGCAAVIDDTESSEEEKVQAMELKDAIEMMIELESDMETAIKGRGYEEVIVELDEDGYIYVTVMAEELTEQEVMVLAGIAIDTTGATLDQIVVKNIS